MFPSFTSGRSAWTMEAARFSAGRVLGVLALGLIAGVSWCGICAGATESSSDLVRGEPSLLVTNVAQFRSIPAEAFLGHCAFQLSAAVTLVDTNRDLLVLQDETGVVGLIPKAGLRGMSVQVGQRVLAEGSRCFPAVLGFPNYPYRPSGWDLRPSFEAPTDWGEYHLTRMRGFLHPPVTGEYFFWIASDNSSELWLSSNSDPTKARKIAFMGRYAWASPHEWSRYPSQRSESVLLQAGRTYYIEALQEQTTGGDNLAVAWQGPSLERSVIEASFLTPWIESPNQASVAGTNGILREYWTNFSMGSLATLAGPRPVGSALSVDELRITPQGRGNLPNPCTIAGDEQLSPEDNYRWVEVQGNVTFTGRDGEVGLLELLDGEARIQVRVLRSDAASLRRYRNSNVRVEGVCEGVYNQKEVLVPGLIWVPTEESISLIETITTNSASGTTGQSAKLISNNTNTAMGGFYGTRGVVTFNDRVFGKDLMFVQEDTAAIFVSLEGRNFENQFAVGRWVELGGPFQPGKNIPTLRPLAVMELGWRSMPAPMTQPVQVPVAGNRDGRWTEAEGVMHSVNSNGTVMLRGVGGPLLVWIGKTSTEALNQYVDARLRVQGVLSLNIQDEPLLLVPSTSFVDVESEAPTDPFTAPIRLVSNLLADDAEAAMAHRVKLAGNVTYNGQRSFFMQDATGGVRVQPIEDHELRVGQAVEVVGFPSASGAVRTLTEALVRPVGGVRALQPEELDAGEGISFKHAGTLVQISAKLIALRNRDGSQVLELQEKQRVFEAELPLGPVELPAIAPGSRLRLRGVCDFTTDVPAASGSVVVESPLTGALRIRLRSPADVVLLSGPPWWTWQHTAVLVGTLLMILMVLLLRIHLLRRRLERQLVFSRQIIESQESERHRIAANLHDGLGQNLLVIKNQVRLAMQPAVDESMLRQRLDEISGCASQAIEEVREITHALRPYQLDRLGLTQTIRASVSRAAENSSIVFASHVDGIEGLFDKESEIHVYRIVQEAVNNILKHSAATEAAVVVRKLAAGASLSVRDNGRGFDAGATYDLHSDDLGHGLSGIKERVRILGGTFEIDSRPGQGTTLSIEIPVSLPKHET